VSGVVIANQPGVYFVDADGNVITADDGDTISNHEGILIAGKDGTAIRFMRVAADGTLRIDPTGTTTQPISASSLPLPTGAATEAKLEAVRLLLASIKDTDGIKKIIDALPVGDNLIGRTKLTDGTLIASLIEDTVASLVRLAVEGKVSIVSPTPPGTATEVVLASDTPLGISTTSTATYVIPDGDTFHLQSLSTGAEGDPTEKGSKVEVIFDNAGTERLVTRLYVSGFTVFQSFNDVSKSRDDTSMVGNAGGTNKVLLRRIRLSGSVQEVDAEIRGYVQ